MSTPLHKLNEIRIACECCILFKNKILLQKRPSDSKNFPNFWTFPGGHIDYGEDAVSAIIREIKEETEIVIDSSELELKVNAINNHIDKNQIWFILGFKAKLTKFQEAVSSEEGEVRWFNIEEAKNLLIFPPIKYYFNFIISNKKGTLFMAADWENSELKNLLKENYI